jgi:hypothetical protein
MVDVVTAEVLEPIVEPLLLAQQLVEPFGLARGRELAVHALERREHLGAAGDAADDDVVYRGVGRQQRLLRQVADAQLAAHRALAGVGLQVGGEDAQQRRLAAAVRAEQPDALAVTDDQRHALQQVPVAERHVHVLERQQRHPQSVPEAPPPREVFARAACAACAAATGRP